MRRLLKLFLPLSLVALGFALFLLANKRKENYAMVEEREVKTLIYCSGYAKREDYIIVKSEVSGYVEEVLVEEGQRVKKGQVLARLSTGSLDASIREVSERLSLAEERLKEGSDYFRTFESAVESARLSMERAREAYERRERLFRQGLIPKEAYENSKLQYETALKEYERAVSSYKDAKKALEYEVKVLSAERERLMKEKEKYTIKSPVEGYVLKKFVSVGDYINHMSQENRLFSVGSGGWEVWLDVDEEYAGLVKEGQRVFLRLDAYPGQVFEGRVFQVIREVDRSRKLFTVKAKAELPEHMPSGTTVDGQIEVEPRRVLLLPVQAYRDGYVLVYDGVRYIKVQVRVGRRLGDYYEVLEGLKKGDRVVLP